MGPIGWLIVFILTLLSVLIVFYFYYKKNNKSVEIETLQRALLAYRRINKIILEDLDFKNVAQKIADTIPNELKFGTGVLAIIDEEKGVLKRIAASKTTEAQKAIHALSVPFNQITIPLNDPDNLMVRSIRERKSFITSQVYDVFVPVLTRQESQRIQDIMSTATTLIYPIYIESKVVGVFVASTSKKQSQLSKYEFQMIESLVESSGIALHHASLYKKVEDETLQLSKVNQQIMGMNQRLHDLDELKDDFISVASHELRTPMTAIRSYAWMALNRSDVPLSDQMKRYLGRTLLSTERLINLVNDLLNISRIESGRVDVLPRPFDMLTLIDDSISEIGPQANEKGVHIQIMHDHIPLVFADPDKVHQVLLNLLGNALKFTPAEGTITISLISDGASVESAIKDSGVGISKDDMSKLFTKFGRLDSSYVAAATSGGTGLGLYISKILIELMKGRIWGESEGSGKGATFKFSLPAATPEIINQADKFTHRFDGESKPLEPVAI